MDHLSQVLILIVYVDVASMFTFIYDLTSLIFTHLGSVLIVLNRYNEVSRPFASIEEVCAMLESLRVN